MNSIPKVLLVTWLIVSSHSRLLNSDTAKTQDEGLVDIPLDEKAVEPAIEVDLKPVATPIVVVEKQKEVATPPAAVVTSQSRGKIFYPLMAVAVLFIGAVCSAFILGKKKE